MEPLAEFLTPLFDTGQVVLRGVPSFDRRPTAVEPVASILRRAFGRHRLDVAGPEIDLDLRVAVDCAEFLRRACWALADRSTPKAELARALTLRRPDRSASAHLSGDLTLRYAPQVLRRACGADPSDVVVTLLERALHDWPLSGVLAGLDEGPGESPGFDHDGLNLLYAERFARHRRDAWRLRESCRQFVELVMEHAR